jgi:transposase InsO family protein
VLRRPVESTVYTSLAFSSRLVELELDQSFSAVGSCYDCETVSRRQAAWLLLTTDPAVWVSLLLICRPPGGAPNTVLAGPVVTS